MDKIKEFFKKLLDNSKIIIIILLCVIALQTCSRCSHNTKDQWRDTQYTEQLVAKDSIINIQKATIDSLNIELIVARDSAMMYKSGYERSVSNEKSLLDDKAMMREIIRNQNKKD